MRKLIGIIVAIFLSISVFAQTPQKMSYQAVIRNSSDQLVTNHAVGMRVSILQGSANGIAMYVETQTQSTNANGLVSIEIGGGTPVTGTFAGIDWSTGTYFIKTETDPTGGTSYTITGTSQLLSVPYAMYSKTAQTADYNNLTNRPNLSGYITSEADPVFGSSASFGISNANINNWNTAFGWGNHATAGYLTSFTEVDPKVGLNTTNYVSKWNGISLISSTIFDNGNVGIGTTGPTFPLTLEKNTFAGLSDLLALNNLQSPNPANAVSVNFRMRDNVGGGNELVFARIRAISTTILDPNQTGALAIDARINSTTLTEVMRIQGSSVGIGTISPGTKLDVNGVITATGGNSTSWNTAYSWGNHATAGYITSFTELDPKIGTNTLGYSPKWNGSALVTGAIFQDASGNVGIGNTSPTNKLTVSGIADVATSVQSPLFTPLPGVSNTLNIQTNDGAGNSGNMTIRSGDVSANGSTGGSLTVRGGNYTGGYKGAQLSLQGYPGSNGGGSATLSGGDGWSDTGGDVAIQGGNKGWGNGGSIYINGGNGGSGAGGGGHIFLTTGNDASAGPGVIVMKISGTEAMRINASANVGIGTASPQGALDVTSTTGAFIVPRMTTTQRDAITPVNGMIIYNTTNNQFNFYENGAWTLK